MKQTEKRKLFVVFAVLSVMALLIAGWWAIRSHQPASPWQPTTVPYDAKCEGDCLKNLKEIADIETPHLSGVKIVVRTDINDAIAQLGDCLDSIMGCVDETGDLAQTAACVKKSQCPKECRGAYAKQFSETMTAEQQFKGLRTIFLVDNAVCAPREAEQ